MLKFDLKWNFWSKMVFSDWNILLFLLKLSKIWSLLVKFEMYNLIEFDIEPQIRPRIRTSNSTLFSVEFRIILIRIRNSCELNLLWLSNELYIKTGHEDHGRPQTFFQGRAKFSRGWGAKTYCLPKNALKHTIFFQKSRNTYCNCRPRGGGQMPPLILPCGRPC